MKRTAALIFLAIALSGFHSEAQAPSSRAQKEKQLLNLVKEVQGQQTSIVENQKKIDGQIADLAETVRVARLYAARGGH
jgi:hypothetical protein